MAAIATAIVPAISTGVETAEKAEREVERVEKRLHERSTEVFKRKLETYDFEKVFFNSAYGTGLFCVGWASLKVGQFMIGLVDWLNSWGMPFTGWPGSLIPDEGMVQMKKIGNVLNEIDAQFLVPYGPAVPVTITALASLSEYLRTRGFMPEKNRHVADAAVGLIGLGVLQVVSVGLNKPVVIDRKGDGDLGQSPGGIDIISIQEYFPPQPWPAGSNFHIFLLRLAGAKRQIIVKTTVEILMWQSPEWDEAADTQNVLQGQYFDAAKAWCLSQGTGGGGAGGFTEMWHDANYVLEDRCNEESRYVLLRIADSEIVMEWASGSYNHNEVVMAAKAYAAANQVW